MAPNCIRNSTTTNVKSSGRQALKKGPWTASEDMLLVEYVKKHGEGNWNAVQRNSGLMRCGKSCRLRWANHLRPNLKKGAFSPDEERLIVELHAKLGNKWARMAAQMPGRTDNEIKNYWNTRLKRRQRAGLPIYPQEIRQQEQQQQQHQLLLMNNNNSSFSSLLGSSHHQNPNPNPFCFFNPPPPPPPPNIDHLNPNNSGLALSFSSMKTPNFLNQSNSSLPVPNSMIQYNPLSFGINSSSPTVGVLGLPSIQSVTPAASSSDHFMMAATSSDDAEEYEVDLGFSRCNKSGLLEDLLEESQAFAGVEIPEDSSIAAPPGNVHRKDDFSFCHGTANSENNYQGRVQKASGDSINTVDDDLLNLLDNFPLAVPIPEWNEGNGYESRKLANGTNVMMDSQPHDSQYNPVTTSSRVANQDWNFGSLLWNNMPTIS